MSDSNSDLYAVEVPMELEALPDGMALNLPACCIGTFSSFTSASCPISTVACGLTASSECPS